MAHFSGKMSASEHMLLPKQVEINQSSLPGEKLGVFSTMWIKEGTQMGPYTGRLLHVNQVDIPELNNFTWEVRISSRLFFNKQLDGQYLRYYLKKLLKRCFNNSSPQVKKGRLNTFVVVYAPPHPTTPLQLLHSEETQQLCCCSC